MIYLYNVTNVIKGIGTDVMQRKGEVSNMVVLLISRHRPYSQLQFTARRQQEHLCWSIVTEDRTLDLQAQSQHVRDRWVDGVRLAMTNSTLLSPEEIQLVSTVVSFHVL